MKKFILFLCLSPSISFSQHQYFPATDATWDGNGITWCGTSCAFLHCYHFYVDTTQVDTVIGSNTYSIMRHHYLSTNDYFCAFRTDTLENAIFIVPGGGVNEELFFDFDETYNVGDTIEFNMYQYPESDNIHFVNFEAPLEQIDSILVGGTYYNTYDFGTISLEASGFQITEHFLNIQAFPFCMPHFFETVTELKCYSEGGNEIAEVSTECPWTDTDCTDWQNLTGSVAESKLMIDVDVYPNPTSDVLQFSTASEEMTALQIIDQNGKVVIETVFQKQLTLDISQLPAAGLYLYRLQNAGGIQSGSFIKN